MSTPIPKAMGGGEAPHSMLPAILHPSPEVLDGAPGDLRASLILAWEPACPPAIRGLTGEQLSMACLCMCAGLLYLRPVAQGMTAWCRL